MMTDAIHGEGRRRGSLLRSGCKALASVGLALAGLSVLAAQNTIPDNYTLTGPTVLQVASNATNIYTGKITGTGPLIFKGGNGNSIAALACKDNDFTEGIILSNATLRLDAVGAAGTGKITGAQGTAYVFVNCATVTNDLEFIPAGGTAYGSIQLRGLAATAELTGAIRGYTTRLSIGSEYLGSTGKGHEFVTRGDIVSKTADGAPRMLNTFAYGTNTIHGRIECDMYFMDGSPSSTAGGVVNIHSMSNSVANWALMRGGTVNLYAANAFPGTPIAWWYFSGGKNRGRMDLHGNDQEFGALGTIEESLGSLSDYDASYANVHCVYSDEPCTVKLVGYDPAVRFYDDNFDGKIKAGHAMFPMSPASINGNVSLLIDAPDYPGFEQSFTNRVSKMTGTIAVSNGTLRLCQKVQFANVPAVTVGPNGKLVFDRSPVAVFPSSPLLKLDGALEIRGSTPSPFDVEKTVLRVGPDASITMPADMQIAVKKVIAVDAGGNERELDPAVLTHAELPQIKSGSIYIPATPQDATWTGGGADDTSVQTAANWNKADIQHGGGGLTATFATGGTRAELDRDAFWNGIVFSGTADFTIGSTALHALTLFDRVTASSAGTFAFEAPLVFSSGNDAPAIDTADGAVVDVRGGLSYLHNSGRLGKSGKGTLKLSGTTTVASRLDVTAGQAVFSGLVTDGSGGSTPLPDASTYNTNPEPTARQLVAVTCSAPSAGQPAAAFVLDDAVFETWFWTTGPGTSAELPGRTNWFVTAAGSTNVFKSYAYMKSPVGRVTLGGGSKLEFVGKMCASGQMEFVCPDAARPAEVHFSNPAGSIAAVSGGSLRAFDNVIFRFSGCNNHTYYLDSTKKNVPTSYAMYFSGSNGAFIFEADDVFENGYGAVSAETANSSDFTMHLGKTHQKMFYLSLGRSTSTVDLGTIYGEEGSMLEIVDDYDAAGNAGGGGRNNTYFQGIGPTGALSIRYLSTGVDFVCRRSTWTTTGSLYMSGKRIAFDATSTWRTGTDLTLDGRNKSGSNTTLLELNNTSGTFDGRKMVIKALGNWKIGLVSGIVEHVKDLYVDGVPVPPGTYGSSTSPAANKTYASHFTGNGVLKVSGGIVLIVR